LALLIAFIIVTDELCDTGVHFADIK